MATSDARLRSPVHSPETILSKYCHPLPVSTTRNSPISTRLSPVICDDFQREAKNQIPVSPAVILRVSYGNVRDVTYVNPMAQMAKVTINWTGLPGGPGYTNLYFQDISGPTNVDQTLVDSAVSKTDAWIAAFRPALPTSIFTAVSATVEAVDENTGELQSFWTGTPAAAAAGSGGTSYSAPSGAVVSWYTSTVRNSRRIRGRTFIVPLATSAYDTDGSILNARITTWNAATATLIATGASAELGVWSRPSGPSASDGDWALVTSFRIPDAAAILTSRRS